MEWMCGTYNETTPPLNKCYPTEHPFVLALTLCYYTKRSLWKEKNLECVGTASYREESGGITIQYHVSSCSDRVQSGAFEWTAGNDASAIGIRPIFLILFLAPSSQCLHRCYGVHRPQCAAIIADTWPGRSSDIFFTRFAPHNGGKWDRWSARN